MGTYYLFSPFLRRILLPNVKAELSCYSCYFIHKQGMCSIDLDQEDRHSSVLLICLISEHPNSIFSMVMTQLKFWIRGLASVKFLGYSQKFLWYLQIASVPFSFPSAFETKIRRLLDPFILSCMTFNLFYIFYLFISQGYILDNFSSSSLQFPKYLFPWYMASIKCIHWVLKFLFYFLIF